MARSTKKRLKVELDPVTAFLDAADELLAAQQALLGADLPPEIRRLTEAYLERRRKLLGMKPSQSG
jgi:hypothetical protein